MFKLGFKVLLPSCHYLRRHKINLQQINSQAVSELFNLSTELLADFFFLSTHVHTIKMHLIQQVFTFNIIILFRISNNAGVGMDFSCNCIHFADQHTSQWRGALRKQRTSLETQL